jgi:hypothetical protein
MRGKRHPGPGEMILGSNPRTDWRDFLAGLPQKRSSTALGATSARDGPWAMTHSSIDSRRG